jgi:hypothetical protein
MYDLFSREAKMETPANLFSQRVGRSVSGGSFSETARHTCLIRKRRRVIAGLPVKELAL